MATRRTAVRVFVPGLALLALWLALTAHAVRADSPVVAGINPTTGPALGGTSVTLEGAGFVPGTAGTQVFFGSFTATNVNCTSSSSCTATSPPGDGIVPVTVAVGAALSAAVSAAQFTYMGAASDTWTQEGPTVSPLARGYAMAAFDSKDGQTLLFGGANRGALGDTWTWNGSSVWVQEHPQHSPPARYVAGIASDSFHNVTVLFGGCSTQACGANDTWTWDGADWTQQIQPGCTDSCPNSPPARNPATMAFDATNNVTVLFGGEEDTYLADTWTYDAGTNTWTQQHPTTSPPARAGAMMAFDGQHVILYGGEDDAGLLGDMWSWDGTNWTAVCGTTTPQTAACPPGARVNGMMAFDSDTKTVLLAGGCCGSNFTLLGDTWLWNGSTSTWTNQTPVASPSARSGATLVYDSAHQKSVLFGGDTSQGHLGDTWTWFENSGPSCKTGDVNCDGTVDATDALCVLRLVAFLPNTQACPVPEPNAAKISTDGNPKLDATDALCILRAVAKLAATNACPTFPAPIANRTEGTGDRGQGTGTAAATSATQTSPPAASPPSLGGKGAGGIGPTRPSGAATAGATASVRLGLQPAELHGAPGTQTTVTLTLDASRLTPHAALVGAWTVDLGYDPSQLKIVNCQAGSGGLCNASYASSLVRVVGASASGLSGKLTLATLTVEGVGHGKPSPLTLTAVSLADTNGEALPPEVALAPEVTQTPSATLVAGLSLTPSATPGPSVTPRASPAATPSPTVRPPASPTPKRRPG